MAGKAKFDQEAAFKSIVGAARQPAPGREPLASLQRLEGITKTVFRGLIL